MCVILWLKLDYKIIACKLYNLSNQMRQMFEPMLKNLRLYFVVKYLITDTSPHVKVVKTCWVHCRIVKIQIQVELWAKIWKIIQRAIVALR